MTKNTNKFLYKNTLPKLFASFAILAFGLLATINSFVVSGLNPGINLITFVLKIAVPSAILMWFIGYFIGEILDRNPEKRHFVSTFIPSSKAHINDPHKIESVFSTSNETPEHELPVGDVSNEQ